MLSDRARLALLDIADNLRLAQEFVAGISFDVFKTDRLRFYAVTRALEIISEAARPLPAALHERHPELPWRAIMASAMCVDTTATMSRKNTFGEPSTKALLPRSKRLSKKSKQATQ